MGTEHLPLEEAERSVVVFFFVMGGMAAVSVLMGGSLTGAVVGLFAGFVTGEIAVHLWNRMVKQRQRQQILGMGMGMAMGMGMGMMNEQMQKMFEHVDWSAISKPNPLEVECHPEDIEGDEK